MSERLIVREDCLAWSTTMKKGNLVADGNPKIIPLAKGQEVEVVGPGLAVDPTSLFVKMGEVTIEVRRSFLTPA